MTADTAVSGTVAPGFEDVRAAFERNGESGGAFAAMVDGQVVADLWGGIADPATGRPWSERTCAVVFSGTKGSWRPRCWCWPLGGSSTSTRRSAASGPSSSTPSSRPTSTCAAASRRTTSSRQSARN